MSEREDFIDNDVVNILTKLKQEEKRYQDLKVFLNISDATLSKKINLLKENAIIEPHSSKNKTGKNYIVYSLTSLGIKLEKAMSEYLKHVDTITVKIRN